jgi:hypothetical protein
MFEYVKVLFVNCTSTKLIKNLMQKTQMFKPVHCLTVNRWAGWDLNPGPFISQVSALYVFVLATSGSLLLIAMNREHTVVLALQR